MFEELTGIPVPQLVILIGTEESNTPSVFVERRNDWIYKAMDRINLYKKSLL
jgi:hypothetical protein